MIVTYFCKKGGVGKTTVLGEHANYLASKGKKVCMLSVDDQNSIFDMFGKFAEVFDKADNYFEHLLSGLADLDTVCIPVRDNLVAIKTLNTDMLSKKLTLERQFERVFLDYIKKLEDKFDYVFVDLPPSNCRVSEVVFEKCENIVLIVELNKLGVSGFYNTLQYFTDVGIDPNKIKYILPNGFSKSKSIPAVAMDELKKIAQENIEKVVILKPLPERTNIQVLQQKGVSMFDAKAVGLNNYQRQQKNESKKIFEALFKTIKF